MNMLHLSNVQRTLIVTVALVGLVGTVGCGNSGPELVPASGVVLMDGEPVADAAVLFMPVGEGPAASGTTDTQGKFELTTANESGAVPGQYKVTVTKQIVPDMYDAPEKSGVEWVVPERYSRPETSDLTATVDEDNSEFTFELSSE